MEPFLMRTLNAEPVGREPVRIKMKPRTVDWFEELHARCVSDDPPWRVSSAVIGRALDVQIEIVQGVGGD